LIRADQAFTQEHECVDLGLIKELPDYENYANLRRILQGKEIVCSEDDETGRDMIVRSTYKQESESGNSQNKLVYQLKIHEEPLESPPRGLFARLFCSEEKAIEHEAVITIESLLGQRLKRSAGTLAELPLYVLNKYSDNPAVFEFMRQDLNLIPGLLIDVADWARRTSGYK